MSQGMRAARRPWSRSSAEGQRSAPPVQEKQVCSLKGNVLIAGGQRSPRCEAGFVSEREFGFRKRQRGFVSAPLITTRTWEGFPSV